MELESAPLQWSTTLLRGCILGTYFDLCQSSEVLNRVLEWRVSGDCGYIILAPPHSVMEARRDPRFNFAMQQGGMVLPDGVGITLAAEILGYPHNGRVPGPSLMLWLCDHGRTWRLRHYFYGGGEGVAEKLAWRLKNSYADLKVAGYSSPPFRALLPEEDERMIELINGTSPDIVWVALGTKKQEIWMAEHKGRIRAAAMIGVGAAFDFHTGQVSWAPGWIRKAGLEWAYRLLQEPRRLWRRNLDSPLFLLAVLGQRVGWIR